MKEKKRKEKKIKQGEFESIMREALNERQWFLEEKCAYKIGGEKAA